MANPYNETNKEKIREAVNYPSYFEERAGPLKDAGEKSQVLGTCPFHKDTRGSLSINLNSGLWNCKGCGESGDIFTIHMMKTGLTFKDALEDLAKLYNVTMDMAVAKKGLPNPKQIEELQKALQEYPGGIEALKESRGLTKETIEKYKLGYHTKRKRLTIPVYDEYGALINLRMYSSTAEEKMVSWGKGFGGVSLYGANNLKDYPKDEEIIICEGEFDRLLLCQEGFHAITHTNGALSFKKDMVKHFKGRKVVLVYDGDGFTKEQAKTAGPNGGGKDEDGKQIKAQKRPGWVRADH